MRRLLVSSLCLFACDPQQALVEPPGTAPSSTEPSDAVVETAGEPGSGPEEQGEAQHAQVEPGPRSDERTASLPEIEKKEVYKVLMVGEWWFALDVDRWLVHQAKGGAPYELGRVCPVQVQVSGGKHGREGIKVPGYYRQEPTRKWIGTIPFRNLGGSAKKADEWLGRIEQTLRETPPDLILVMMAPEPEPMRLASGEKVEPGSEAWNEAYSARLNRLLDILEPTTRRVLWAEMPDPALAGDPPGAWGAARAMQIDVLKERDLPVDTFEFGQELVDEETGLFPRNDGHRPVFYEGIFQGSGDFWVLSEVRKKIHRVLAQVDGCSAQDG